MPQPSDYSWSSGVGEGEHKGVDTHTRKEASDVAQTKLGVGRTVIFATTVGRRQVRSNLMEPMFAFGELI